MADGLREMTDGPENYLPEQTSNYGRSFSPAVQNYAEHCDKYGIRRVEVNQEGPKFRGTHKLQFCAGDVNLVWEIREGHKL
jgi:hypothetical protein